MFRFHHSQVVLFILSPFLALLTGIKNYKSEYFTSCFYLFIIFYGYTFTTASDAFDASRITSSLQEAQGTNFWTYTDIENIISTGNTQIVQESILWLVANTFESSEILFAIYAAIFGYFYIRNYRIALQFLKFHNSFYVSTFFITLLLIIPIWEINGWRMWTASHIFIFSTLSILLKKIKIRYMALLLLTPFIHFSFWVIVTPTLLYFIINKLLNNKVLYICYILTLFVNPLKLNIKEINVGNNLEYANSKIVAYGNEEFIEASKEQSKQMSFHAKVYRILLNWGVVIPFLMLVYNSFKNEFHYNYFLKYSLYFGIFVNLISFLPISNLERFSSVFYIFAIFICLAILKVNNYLKFEKYLIIRLFVIVSLWFFNLVEIRKGFDRFGIATLITNPITAPFFPKEDNIALINLIK